jgi:uncharacterized protein (DUF433 family)
VLSKRLWVREDYRLAIAFSDDVLMRGCDNRILNGGLMASERVIVQDPDIYSGEPVFRGTRVPFQTLLDYLQGGETLNEFLEQYPGVSRQAAILALEEAGLASKFSL